MANQDDAAANALDSTPPRPQTQPEPVKPAAAHRPPDVPGRAAAAIIWWIAAFKLMKGTLLLLVAFGAFRMLGPDREKAVRWFIEHLRSDPNNHRIHALLEWLLGISSKTLREIEFGTIFYASLFYIEGVGLLMRKRWAEWMTVVTGSALIPVEIWELITKPHPLKALVLVFNVAIVAYLVWRLKRRID